MRLVRSIIGRTRDASFGQCTPALQYDPVSLQEPLPKGLSWQYELETQAVGPPQRHPSVLCSQLTGPSCLLLIPNRLLDPLNRALNIAEKGEP